MAKVLKVKSVAFNVADPDQRELFEHATKRTNFSSYIKRLIQRDLEGGHTARASVGIEFSGEDILSSGVI
jgi:hypothetical protein